jgi:PKHD-type hydroxylase
MEALETRDLLTAVHIYERAFPIPAIAHLNALADVRGGAILPLDREQEEGLYRLLLRIAEHANQTVFGFELTGLKEPVLLTRREAGEPSESWRTGMAADPRRKLGLLTVLAEPEKGGGFEVFHEHEPTALALPPGRVAVFPGYVLHRFAPVKHGAGRTLLAWVLGPPYR